MRRLVLLVLVTPLFGASVDARKRADAGYVRLRSAALRIRSVEHG